MQYFFDCILYNVSSRTQAGGRQLTQFTQQVDIPISLKYLAELSVVILKLYQITTMIHYLTKKSPSEN